MQTLHRTYDRQVCVDGPSRASFPRGSRPRICRRYDLAMCPIRRKHHVRILHYKHGHQRIEGGRNRACGPMRNLPHRPFRLAKNKYLVHEEARHAAHRHGLLRPRRGPKARCRLRGVSPTHSAEGSRSTRRGGPKTAARATLVAVAFAQVRTADRATLVAAVFA